MKIIIECAANFHARDNYALRSACYIGHLEVVKQLVLAGADVQLVDNSSICLAAWGGHLDIVNSLIESGTRVDARDNSPLRAAAARFHGDVVWSLVAREAVMAFKWNEEVIGLGDLNFEVRKSLTFALTFQAIFQVGELQQQIIAKVEVFEVKTKKTDENWY